MKLNTITLDEAALRVEFNEGEEDYPSFGEYDHEDYDQDYMIQEVTNIVSDLIHSGNAALAGSRPHPLDGSTIVPTESITMNLIADGDRTVGGFTFSYTLWGTRHLEIPTRYVEARHMRGDEDGIEGVVEIAHYIVALVNAAISDFNEFVVEATA